MHFDPTIDYGIRNSTIDNNLIFSRFCELIKALITISVEGDKQKDIIGYGCVAEEMATEFETYFSFEYNSYIEKGLLSSETLNLLIQFDQFLEARSGEKMPDFWNDDLLGTHPDWHIARQKAKDIVKKLDMQDLEIKFDRKEDVSHGEKRIIVQFTKSHLVRKDKSV